MLQPPLPRQPLPGERTASSQGVNVHSVLGVFHFRPAGDERAAGCQLFNRRSRPGNLQQEEILQPTGSDVLHSATCLPAGDLY